MKNLLILLAACLPLMILPGCQTAKAVDQIKSETIAAATERSADVPASITAAIEAWWLEREASGEGATLAEAAEATKRLTAREWASAKEDVAAIYKDGEQRIKEASKGWMAELGSNAPAAFGRVATGDWVGGIMALLGIGAGAVGVSRKYTAKVVTENDDRRESKYRPGGSHAELEALLKAAPELQALLADARAKREGA